MSGRIQPGTIVEWTSQAHGYRRTKQGEVLAYLPAGSNAWWRLREVGHWPVPVSRLKGDPVSTRHRYLVAVPRGQGVDYYCPSARMLESQPAAGGGET